MKAFLPRLLSHSSEAGKIFYREVVSGASWPKNPLSEIYFVSSFGGR